MRFKKETPDQILSHLGEGVEIVGELSFNQGLRVDGIVKGKIRSEASLMVGSKGRVEGEVTVRRVSINGEFRGTIHASDRIEIHKEGKVFGDLFTPCLIIEAGAFFEGKCNMNASKIAKGDEGMLLKVVENSPETVKTSQQAAGHEKTWLK